MSSLLPPAEGARDFTELMRELERHPWRAEVEVEQIPAPQRIAPHAVAIAADVMVDGDEMGNGRLVLLQDPAGNEAWAGTHRFVTFARADVDPEMVTDALLSEVAWSWLTEALENRAAIHSALSGTVTSISSRSFGEIDQTPDRAEVEIRASWTPDLSQGLGISSHLAAWEDLLCTTAGVPALPPGIVALGGRTGRPR